MVALKLFPIGLERLNPSVKGKSVGFIRSELLGIFEGASDDTEQMLLFIDHRVDDSHLGESSWKVTSTVCHEFEIFFERSLNFAAERCECN